MKYIILGHENPDVDSIVSGYLLEKLMTKFGYNAEFIIPDKKIDEENITICREYGLNPYDYQKSFLEAGDARFILVDHHARQVPGEIVGVIDHHPTLEAFNYPYYKNENASSTSCMICRGNEEFFDKEDLTLAILAGCVDTASFHSTKTRESDVVWAREISKKYGIDYERVYKTGLCLTDICDIKRASLNGLKKYVYSGYKVESAYIQVEDQTEICSSLDQMLDYLRDYVAENDLEIFAFIVHDMKEFKTTVYDIKNSGYTIRKYEKYTSRGNTIMPEIEEMLKNRLESKKLCKKVD